MLEMIETSLYFFEYKIYDSLVSIRQHLRRSKFSQIFDSEILEAYK
ncbi:MAG: hypothetical protein OEL84_01395 [Nitrosopumilus sp.]|nr:hypothetical protein [Nitrosopumilus sp.]